MAIESEYDHRPNGLVTATVPAAVLRRRLPRGWGVAVRLYASETAVLDMQIWCAD